MRNNKKKMRFVALSLASILAILLLLSGCGQDKEKKVTVVLDYVINTNHTGMYVALDQGYYEKEDLDVDIIEPADNTTSSLIAAGKGDFGITFQEEVMYAKAAEDPLPIKAVATIIQHNTSGFASYKGKDIKSPKDFENKTYAGWGAPSEEAVINAVMNKDGGDFESVNIVVSDGSGFNLLKKNVDFMWFYWAWDGIGSERAGVPIDYQPLKDLDERLDYYTPIIITNDDLIENDPELIKKFLKATEKGYSYCIEKPKEAAEILHKYAQEYDLDLLIESQEFLAGEYVSDAKSWGLMKDTVWEKYGEFMVENRLIDKNISPSECYSNDFLAGNANEN